MLELIQFAFEGVALLCIVGFGIVLSLIFVGLICSIWRLIKHQGK